MTRARNSLDRELRSINRGIKDYQRETGDTILWFEFDVAGTTKDPVYDEGPSRKWKKGKPVPVIFAYFHEDEDRPNPEGFYMVSTLHFTVLVDTLRKAGISDPLNTDKHMHDRFSFDGRTYSINGYRKQGHLDGRWITIAVDGTQVKEDELHTDADATDDEGDPIYG